jgi:hypothetical protein
MGDAMTLAGYKDFVNGAVLTEGDLDNYFMSQITGRFATTTARDAAITSPLEGMLAMVNATNDSITYFNGSAWKVWLVRGAGSPEGVETADKGALFFRTDGAAGSTIYEKTTDSANTGWVAVGSGTSAFVGAILRANTTNQTLSTGTNTPITLDDEVLDTDGFHSGGSNTRFTVPAGKAGEYMFTGRVGFAQNATGRRLVSLRKNGTTQFAQIEAPAVSSGATTGVMISEAITLAVGDYVELIGYQSSGGNLDVYGSSTPDSTALTGYLIGT